MATFALVRKIARTMPAVEEAIRYDGARVLRLGGCFMAGIASHPSAEPDSLIVRISLDDRELLLADASDVYYVTDYYRPHPVVLARLARLDREALHDLLSMSRRLTLLKARGGAVRTPPPSGTLRSERPAASRGARRTRGR